MSSVLHGGAKLHRAYHFGKVGAGKGYMDTHTGAGYGGPDGRRSFVLIHREADIHLAELLLLAFWFQKPTLFLSPHFCHQSNAVVVLCRCSKFHRPRRWFWYTHDFCMLVDSQCVIDHVTFFQSAMSDLPQRYGPHGIGRTRCRRTALTRICFIAALPESTSPATS